MDVTVLLCTWNRAPLLDQSLAGLAKLQIPKDITWEVLAIDNGSSDGTQDVLRRWGERLPLRVDVESQPGKSRALNRGLLLARGTYVLCTDDDALVDPLWLSAFATGTQRHPSAAIFGGRVLPWFPVGPDPDLLSAFPVLGLGFCAVDHDLPEGPLPERNWIVGANLAFRTDVARALGFDTNLGPRHGEQVVGEERDLITRARRLGHEPIWLPDMIVRHYVAPDRMTLKYLLHYYHDWAVTVVRLEGVPEGPSVLGAPRWILTSLAENTFRAVKARITGHRVEYLVARRDISYAHGLWRECRRLSRAHSLSDDDPR
jgi:glycosyltransferase involved in cell wall biosynthesis